MRVFASERSEDQKIQIRLPLVPSLFSTPFTAGVTVGFIEVRLMPSVVTEGVVEGHQIAFGAYVLRVRLRNRRINWFGLALPGAIVACPGFAWVFKGDVSSPVWVALPVSLL